MKEFGKVPTCLLRTSKVTKNMNKDTEPIVFRSFRIPGLWKERPSSNFEETENALSLAISSECCVSGKRTLFTGGKRSFLVECSH